ncbi:hypothetical protein BX616_007785, partial [Lobosporangium transversale]
MKVNRRHFVGILYDCVLFEYASQVSVDKNYILSVEDLADSFLFVVDFYKRNRSLMDIPCDQFITRNQLHTVMGLLDYIENLDRGVFELFPRNVELREEAPSVASTASSSARQERKQQEKLDHSSHIGKNNNIHNRIGNPSNISIRSRTDGDPFFEERTGYRGGSTMAADLWNHLSGCRLSSVLDADIDADLNEEYSLVIPGLSKADIQTFLWEYAYIPEIYQDDIATLIRYLRRDEWMMDGSKGPAIFFDWGLEGIQKYSKDYNQNKIRKAKIREQEEAKKLQEEAHRQQEEWNRQQELIQEQEAVHRLEITNDFIWKIHKSSAITSVTSTEIKDFIKTLEMEISEYFDFCFVALTAVG